METGITTSLEQTPSQFRNLVRTGLIEAALATVVVAVGIVRRRRRMRRVARGAAIRA